MNLELQVSTPWPGQKVPWLLVQEPGRPSACWSPLMSDMAECSALNSAAWRRTGLVTLLIPHTVRSRHRQRDRMAWVNSSLLPPSPSVPACRADSQLSDRDSLINKVKGTGIRELRRPGLEFGPKKQSGREHAERSSCRRRAIETGGREELGENNEKTERREKERVIWETEGKGSINIHRLPALPKYFITSSCLMLRRLTREPPTHRRAHTHTHTNKHTQTHSQQHKLTPIKMDTCTHHHKAMFTNPHASE